MARSNKKTMHKILNDEEYRENVAAGYPIDENDLQESYRKRPAQSAGTPQLRPGMKPSKGTRQNPLLAADEEDRATRTTSGIAKAFGGPRQGPDEEEKLNKGAGNFLTGAKKWFNKALYGEEEKMPAKKKRMQDAS